MCVLSLMATQNSQVAAERAAGAAGARLATEEAPRIVVLNAMPLNSLPRSHIRLDILPVALQDLAVWVQRRLREGWQLIHFIRHPATIAALRTAGIPLSEQPNAGLYQYAPGDVLVVVTLRNPPRGQEVQQVNASDLEAWIVTAH
jgi:hypothetical protein